MVCPHSGLGRLFVARFHRWGMFYSKMRPSELARGSNQWPPTIRTQQIEKVTRLNPRLRKNCILSIRTQSKCN
jgi:hypothetical protein